MENLAKKILANNSIQPSKECLRQFKSNFKDAINTEWVEKENHYEAIFYKNEIECIAIYNKNGSLELYKMFLPASYLPETIRNVLEREGEIMNIVLLNKGNSINYEAIIRDKNQERYQVLLTDLGKFVSKRQL